MNGIRGHTFLLALSVLWCGGILAPPLMRHMHLFPAGETITRWVYSPVCHQDPHRTPSVAGVPLTVCTRCSSVYFSFTIVVLLAPFLLKFFRFRLSVVELCLGLAPLAADALLALLTSWQPTAWSRLLTGSIAGAALARFVMPAWSEAWEQIAGHRSYTPSPVKERFS